MYQVPFIPKVDQIAVEVRAQSFKTRSIKNEAKRAALNLTIAMCDLTTLEGMDTDGKVRMMCRKAIQPHQKLNIGGVRVPHTAAVCVYPTMVAVAKEAVGDSGVKVAAVATAFPSGQSFLDIRAAEVRRTVEAGADEIDMVISRGSFLQGDYQYLFDEVATFKEACGEAHLKVILETGELQTYDLVRKASQIAIDAGADFIKTSTGKVSPAATMPVTLVMLETIRDHFLKTGKMVGMKPAGGIRTAKEAWHYLCMVKETLGDAWLSPDWFRFGASSLVNDVLMQLEKLESGRYQAAEYFSLD